MSYLVLDTHVHMLIKSDYSLIVYVQIPEEMAAAYSALTSALTTTDLCLFVQTLSVQFSADLLDCVIHIRALAQ